MMTVIREFSLSPYRHPLAIVALLLLATAKGDGHAWMTAYGCLSWIIVIILFFLFAR